MGYNKVQDTLIKAFKDSVTIDKKALYLFFIKENTTHSDIKGHMPFNRSFGFIYAANQSITELTRTMAHELGHGAFRLKHTFSKENKFVQDQGQTPNLMDYADGNELLKYQWDECHDFDLGCNWFEDGDEAASNDDILLYVRNFVNTLDYKLGKELMFSDVLLDNYLKTSDGNKYRYQQYLINIRTENEYISSKNFEFLPTMTYSTFNSVSGVKISQVPKYTISDNRISVFHEYLHHVNYVGNFFPYRINRDGTVYSSYIYETTEKKYIFKSLYDIELIISQDGLELEYLFDAFKFSNPVYNYLPKYKSEIHDKFINYWLSKGSFEFKNISGKIVYQPTNYIRDELSVYHWCLEYGASLGGFSQIKREEYEKQIDIYKEKLKRFKEYESDKKFTEEGNEKK